MNQDLEFPRKIRHSTLIAVHRVSLRSPSCPVSNSVFGESSLGIYIPEHVHMLMTIIHVRFPDKVKLLLR